MCDQTYPEETLQNAYKEAMPFLHRTHNLHNLPTHQHTQNINLHYPHPPPKCTSTPSPPSPPLSPSWPKLARPTSGREPASSEKSLPRLAAVLGAWVSTSPPKRRGATSLTSPNVSRRTRAHIRVSLTRSTSAASASLPPPASRSLALLPTVRMSCVHQSGFRY